MSSKAIQKSSSGGIGSIRTHHELIRRITPGLRPCIKNLIDEIVKEYGCNTASEIILAEMAGGAYNRIIELTDIMSSAAYPKILTFELTGYYGVMSKELDRANRQYIAAITTLRQIKSPKIDVRVNAKTAFVAQNQQFNMDQKQQAYDINASK